MSEDKTKLDTRYDYSLTWSSTDEQWVASCDHYESACWMDANWVWALHGLIAVIYGIEKEMIKGHQSGCSYGGLPEWRTSDKADDCDCGMWEND